MSRKKYYQYLTEQPCAVCGSKRDVEVYKIEHHTLEPRIDNMRVIPLCHSHHRGYGSVKTMRQQFFDQVMSLEKMLKLSDKYKKEWGA